MVQSASNQGCLDETERTLRGQSSNSRRENFPCSCVVTGCSSVPSRSCLGSA